MNGPQLTPNATPVIATNRGAEILAIVSAAVALVLILVNPIAGVVVGLGVVALTVRSLAMRAGRRPWIVAALVIAVTAILIGILYVLILYPSAEVAEVVPSGVSAGYLD